MSRLFTSCSQSSGTMSTPKLANDSYTRAEKGVLGTLGQSDVSRKQLAVMKRAHNHELGDPNLAWMLR